jgi:hypothetical protein
MEVGGGGSAARAGDATRQVSAIQAIDFDVTVPLGKFQIVIEYARS